MPRREAWSAERIAMLLNAQKAGFRWKAKCVAHDDRDPSLIIWKDRTGRAGFYCAAGCDWHDIADQLRARGVVIGRKLDPDEATPEIKHPEPDEDDARRVAYAQTIWKEGVRCKDTRVELYLAHRNLTLPAFLDGPVVRYHPACPCGGERKPAMLVALRDPISKWVVGVSRCFIDLDGKRIGDRMVLGRFAVAMFGAPADGMHICEGWETGLSLFLDNQTPVWSMMSAGNLERLPLLDGVNHLTAHLDKEPSRTGEKAGQRLYWRWHDAGREVEMLMFEGADKYDYADYYAERDHG